MVLSSGTLKLIVLFAALTCAHTLQCYSYSFYKGIGGFTKEPSHIVTCPYSNYCMRLNGVIHTGSHSIIIRERTCGQSRYVPGAVCQASGCVSANFLDTSTVPNQRVPVKYCCCTGDLCNGH